MLNDFAGQNAALLYKSKEPWMCTVHAHFYSILGLEIATVHSLNFDNSTAIAQCEISLINLEPEFPKCIAQHAIWNLIVIQIKGELKFIKLEHAVLLL